MLTGMRRIAALLMFSAISASAAQLEQMQDVDQVETPPLENTEVPPVEQAETPPMESAVAPPAEKAETPPVEMAETPPVESVEAPPAEKAEILPVEMAETPPAESAEAPPAEKAETPPVEMAEAPPVEQAETPPVATAEAPPPAQTMGMSEVIALLRQQQDDLAQQRKLLEAQSKEINGLKRELDVLRAPAAGSLTQETIVATEPAVSAPKSQAQAIAEGGDSDEPKTQQQRDTEAGESVAQAQADDPTRALLSDFKGAWRLPGTDAALAIGGYVKATAVFNNDPLEIKDRFIVGSIPVGDLSSVVTEAQSSLTASQSRLNFDLREPTEYGVLRAFIEGDFAGTDDTYRMRHAFGQWNQVLAGKTWSAFVDTEASPEEVDFEGLNGRINVRQSQVRIMPRLGRDYEFQFSMEDPNPEVQNGSGVTRAPDIVASARFQPHSRLHVKLGLLGRQIRAQRDISQGAGSEKKEAWGLTLSGRFTTPWFDARDSLLFQFNAGNGIGRYVNDLASVGEFDGIFDPDTGKLKLFDITAGYVSWQHWWGGKKSMRSNFTLGAVEVDNPSFVQGKAYKRTLRASANLFWTPTPRIDIGAEYLWGNRRNENGLNDDATQLQMAARYRF